MLNGIAKAFSDSTNRYQTSADRKREKDAGKVARQYSSLLFASTIDIIQDDGTTVPSILPATINPMFKQVLYATANNSKATRLMKEATDAVAAGDFNQSNDKFASAATFNSSYIDQPLVAALRTGTWKHKNYSTQPRRCQDEFWHLPHCASQVQQCSLQGTKGS